jgi:hypothetical protein
MQPEQPPFQGPPHSTASAPAGLVLPTTRSALSLGQTAPAASQPSDPSFGPSNHRRGFELSAASRATAPAAGCASSGVKIASAAEKRPSSRSASARRTLSWRESVRILSGEPGRVEREGLHGVAGLRAAHHEAHFCKASDATSFTNFWRAAASFVCRPSAFSWSTIFWTLSSFSLCSGVKVTPGGSHVHCGGLLLGGGAGVAGTSAGAGAA